MTLSKASIDSFLRRFSLDREREGRIKPMERTTQVREIAQGVYAYLQLPGSWGWSNAGLITAGKQGDPTALIDTLYTNSLTRAMHEAFSSLTPSAKHIGSIINTHSNGDHTNGNGLFPGATIIASAQTAQEMRHEPPPFVMQQMAENARMHPGTFFDKVLGPFDFSGVTVTPPTQTFERTLDLQIGDELVQLIHVGPAHTIGDTLVYLPQKKVVFTGDVLFIGSHPLMWAGPPENWLAACDLIQELDVDTIVPGHGPITDKAGVADVQAYIRYVYDQARLCFNAGITSEEAVRAIKMEHYASLSDGERIVVNVDTIFRHLKGERERTSVHLLFQQMEQFVQSRA
jgi:cyclase